MIGNVLENISDSMPYLEPALVIFLTPDNAEILYFPIVSVLHLLVVVVNGAGLPMVHSGSCGVLVSVGG